MAESFEDLLDLTGGSGWWQLRTLLLTCLCGFAGAIQDFLHIFLAAVPDHWCKVQSCGGMTYSEMKNLTIPTQIVHNKEEYSKCVQHDYTLELSHQDDGRCTLNDIIGNQTVGCSKFDYDRGTFQETIVTEWDLVCDHELWASTAQTVFFVGGLVGCFIFGIISDNYGRKTAVIAAALLSIISGPAAALSPNFPLFLVARFFVAFGAAALFCSTYVLVLESVDTKWRGLAGSLMELPYGLGHGCTALLGYYFRHWRHLHLAAMVPIILFLLMVFFVDESPRWLLSQGQANKAEKILRGMAQANRKEGLPVNFSDMVHQVAVKECGSRVKHMSCFENISLFGKQLFSLFRTPKMRRRSLALNFCWFSVSMVFNGGAFNGSNLTENLFLYVLINGFLAIPACLLVPVFLKCVGRRLLMSGFFFLTAATLCSSLLLEPGSLMILALSWVGIGFSMGTAYIVVYVYGSEIFPTTVRSCGIGVATFLAKAGAVCGLYTASTLGKYHKMGPALVLGSVSLLAGFVVLLLPETSNKRMPETVEDVEKD